MPATRQFSGVPNTQMSVTEDDLQAYVDGLLSPESAARVAAYLSACPQERARLDAYRRQNVLMHRLFDWHAHQPEDARIEALVRRYSIRQRRLRRGEAVLRIAAVLAVVVLSGGIGWMGASEFAERDKPRAAFIQQAAAAHDTIGAVDVSAGNFAAPGDGHVKLPPATSTRHAAMPDKAPDFRKNGFDLVGGRVVTTDDGPALHFLYKDATGGRVTLFIGLRPPDGETGQTLVEDDGLVMIHRQGETIAYSLIGDVGWPTLFSLAERVTGMLDRSAQPPDRGPDTDADRAPRRSAVRGDVEAVATPARPAAVAMPVATPAVEAGASPPPTFSR